MTKDEIKAILYIVYVKCQELDKLKAKKSSFRLIIINGDKKLDNEIKTLTNEIKQLIEPLELIVDSIRFRVLEPIIKKMDISMYDRDVRELYGNFTYYLFPREEYRNKSEKRIDFNTYCDEVMILFDEKVFRKSLSDKTLPRGYPANTFHTQLYKIEFDKLLTPFKSWRAVVDSVYESLGLEEVDTSIYASSRKNYYTDDDGGFDPGIG